MPERRAQSKDEGRSQAWIGSASSVSLRPGHRVADAPGRDVSPMTPCRPHDDVVRARSGMAPVCARALTGGRDAWLGLHGARAPASQGLEMIELRCLEAIHAHEACE